MSKTFHYDDTLGFVCRTLRYGNAPTIIESTIGQLNSDPTVNEANANTSNALNALEQENKEGKEEVTDRNVGKWDKDSDMAFYWKCSECGAYLFWRHEEFMVNGNPHFCPNCGADMRETK